jgi:hypothetical protein
MPEMVSLARMGALRMISTNLGNLVFFCQTSLHE